MSLSCSIALAVVWNLAAIPRACRPTSPCRSSACRLGRRRPGLRSAGELDAAGEAGDRPAAPTAGLPMAGRRPAAAMAVGVGDPARRPARRRAGRPKRARTIAPSAATIRTTSADLADAGARSPSGRPTDASNGGAPAASRRHASGGRAGRCRRRHGTAVGARPVGDSDRASGRHGRRQLANAARAAPRVPSSLEARAATRSRLGSARPGSLGRCATAPATRSTSRSRSVGTCATTAGSIRGRVERWRRTDLRRRVRLERRDRRTGSADWWPRAFEDVGPRSVGRLRSISDQARGRRVGHRRRYGRPSAVGRSP